MKQVVHISSVHQPHDTRILLKECASLASAGYEVALVVPHQQDEERNGVRILAVKKPDGVRLRRMLLTTWAVYRRARNEKAALYHFHDPELIPVGILLRLGGAKVIYDVHEDLPRQIESKYYLPRIVRRLVATMAGLAEWIGSRMFFSGIVTATPQINARFPKGKSIAVQNFPVPDELAPSDNPISFHERPKHVLYLGGITETRGIKELIAAIEATDEDARLSLGGAFFPGSLRQDMMKQPGWPKVVEHGWLDRDGVRAQLRYARCGLVTLHPTNSYLASLPVKMFEYMSAGLPVIASDFPLWRELLEPHDCALFVDPLDPKAIAEAIDWVLAHPDEAEAMGRRGMKAVREVYNWQPEEKKLLDFYKELLP